MMSAVNSDKRLAGHEPIFLLLKNLTVNEDDNTTAAAEDDYDYDIDSSFDNYDWAELIPAVVVYSFVLLLGISGNGKFFSFMFSTSSGFQDVMGLAFSLVF